MLQKTTKKHTKNTRRASVPRKQKQRFTRRTAPGMALLSGRQIVYETGMGLKNVYAEMDAGRLPFRYIGNRRYVSRPVFEQWLANFGKDTAA
jgi:hypothetical protein